MTREPVSKPVVHPPDLGQELALLRKELGLTQAQLARRSGVSRNSIGAIERNEWKPKPDTLRAISVGASTVPTGVRDDGKAGLHYERLMRAAGHAHLDEESLVIRPADSEEDRRLQREIESFHLEALTKLRDALYDASVSLTSASGKLIAIAQDLTTSDFGHLSPDTFDILTEVWRLTGEIIAASQPITAEFRLARDRRASQLYTRVMPLLSEEERQAYSESESAYTDRLAADTDALGVLRRRSEDAARAAATMRLRHESDVHGQRGDGGT